MNFIFCKLKKLQKSEFIKSAAGSLNFLLEKQSNKDTEYIVETQMKM